MGWQGEQEIDFRMEADDNWSPDMRLQCCAGFLVAVARSTENVTGFHITRLPHTQNQTYVFTRNGLLA